MYAENHLERPGYALWRSPTIEGDGFQITTLFKIGVKSPRTHPILVALGS